MRLRRNIFYNVFYQISVIIIPLITAPYISRVVGKEGVGVYSYSTSVASYFALFILLGVGNYGARSIARNRDDKLLCSRKFWGIYFLQLICSAVVMTAYVGFIILTKQKYHTALLIQILYLLSVVLDINWYFIGTEQFRITVTRGMIIKFVQVIAIFTFVKSDADVYKYIIIMTGGVLLGQILLFPVLLKKVCFVRVNTREILSHLKPNLILFIPILATSVFTIMDKIMLELINHDIAAVGIYEYSEKIVKLPLGVITAIGTVMLSKISNLLVNNKESQSNTYFQMSMKYIGIIVVAMAFGIAGIAPIFSVVFYGQDFSECGSIITMLAIILMTSSWANIIRTQYLIPHEKDKIYITAVVSGAIVNLGLNYLFIPKFGATGAAIGTIGAELVLCFVHTVAVWKKLNLKVYLKDWILYACCGIAMFFGVRLVEIKMGISILTLIIQVLCGVIIYILLMSIILLIKQDEIFLKFKRRLSGKP
ncbi:MULTISPECIES: flippase [Blautia]|uniref:flippase n=1 Tax=Blautia TaxID=572511 RepID=UPI000BA491A5|nr:MULTISPECIES: flippase [Blautia]